MDNYSLSDIKAAMGGEDGLFGGGGGLLILVILFLFFFMGGRGPNAMADGGALTRAEMQAGFDTQEITRKLDGITNGLSDGFYAQNTTMLNGFAGITAAVKEAQFAAQQCCCETNRNIDGVRYDAQKNTCDIITAIHAEGEATRNLMQQNEIQALRDRIQRAELHEAMCGVVRYPMTTAYTSGGNPFCGGCCAQNI